MSATASSSRPPAARGSRGGVEAAPGPETAAILDAELADLDLAGRIAHLAAHARAPVFTTSLGIEDQVLLDAIARADRSAGGRIRIVTLETGRLFAETLDLIAASEARYGLSIERFRPDPDDIEAYAARYGINGFYDSVEARQACCGLRKLKPLARALDGADAWITGLRRGQSAARGAIALAAFDSERGLVKVNPLADWDAADIAAHAEANAVPVNPLHARGYPSIGCEPCTRAVRPGEPERAGRWWWENDAKRECGLHVSAVPSPENPAA